MTWVFDTDAGWTKPDNAGKSVDVVLDSNLLGFEDKMISAYAPKYRFAFISDTGGPIASSTSFYYNTTNNNFLPTNSLGPGPSAVSSLVQSWKPSEIFAIGDLSYNVGASTTIDAAIGQYYNNFIYPYPSKLYLGKPYDSINGIKVKEGELQWPYNVYNHPVGFPNPIVTNQIGGSPDKLNHFWSALGNHDYGLEIGYAQIGATPYSIGGKDIGSPKGPSSAPTFQSFNDYFLPFLNDPTILGQNKNRLNIGSSDISVNNGAYYSMSFAGTEENPLIEVFMLDTERLNINAGMEDWNPTGKKEYDPNTSLYKNEVKKDRKYSLNYNPADPNSEPFLGTTTNPDNGFKQFEWLTKSLSSSKAKWKILTGHHPVYASGRYFDENPDDHMSNAYLQKLLKALPVGSFDAYYNGHDHFYERVLETNSNGIGLGVPFITNGNNGRNLEAKIQIPYGTSLYNPLPGNSGNPNPNKDATRQLLPSNPTVVGSSGLSWQGTEQEGKHVNGLYGYGFGAVKLDYDQDYLFFNYQEAPLIDPAISNHLAGGINPEQGFNNTTSKDWTPNPNGIYDADKDLATFKLSITNGVVNKVEIINKGQGYMSSKEGNYTVVGFNIYGNNVDIKQPWLGTAQVDLTFTAGKLENINLTDGGIGYDLAVKAAAENNNATTTDGLEPSRDLIVAINYHLDEIQYKVRDDSLYNDWYLITDTIAHANGLNNGSFGSLEVVILPKSEDALNIITNTPVTTSYEEIGTQQKYERAQTGIIELVDSLNQKIGNGTINNGFSELNLTQRAAPGALSLSFGGDPNSSYLINFKPSTTRLALDYGNWQGLVRANPNNSLVFNESATLSMIRIDSNAGLVSFGLAQDTTVLNLLNDAAPASDKSINLMSIYNGSGWQTSEGQAVGSISSKGVKIQSGNWTPTAKREGRDLILQNVNITGNNVTAIFEDGITGSLILPGTGTAITPSDVKPQLTVQRLGSYNNGLAFYEADSITGAVGGLLPGEAGYIEAALANARGKKLLLKADQLPGFGGSSIYDSLPIQADKNYGILLLVNGSESNVFSSYSAANPGGSQQFLSFGSTDRGITVGIEDLLTSNGSDKDYNDLVVILTSASPTVIGNI